jgi:hypothetical protein
MKKKLKKFEGGRIELSEGTEDNDNWEERKWEAVIELQQA